MSRFFSQARIYLFYALLLWWQILIYFYFQCFIMFALNWVRDQNGWLLYSSLLLKEIGLLQAANTGRCITSLNNCDNHRRYQCLFVCTIPYCIKKAIPAVLGSGVTHFITWHCSRCYGLITDFTSFTPHLRLPLEKKKKSNTL